MGGEVCVCVGVIVWVCLCECIAWVRKSVWVRQPRLLQ